MSDEKKTIILNVTWLKKNPIFRKAMVSLVLGFIIVFSINLYNIRFKIFVGGDIQYSPLKEYYQLLDKEYRDLYILSKKEWEQIWEQIFNAEERIPINKLRISPSYFRDIQMEDIPYPRNEGFGRIRYYLSDFLSSYEEDRNIIERIFKKTCFAQKANHLIRRNIDYFIRKKFRNPLNNMYYSMFLSFYDWYYIVLFALIIFVFWIFFKKYKLRIK